MTEAKNNQMKQIPPITSEEDRPLDASLTEKPDSKGNDKLNNTDSLEKEITRFRFQTGKKVLYISMVAMGIAVVLDLVLSIRFKAENEMLKNVFEAFKLITMTVLGYIFGSNTKSS